MTSIKFLISFSNFLSPRAKEMKEFISLLIALEASSHHRPSKKRRHHTLFLLAILKKSGTLRSLISSQWWVARRQEPMLWHSFTLRRSLRAILRLVEFKRWWIAKNLRHRELSLVVNNSKILKIFHSYMQKILSWLINNRLMAMLIPSWTHLLSIKWIRVVPQLQEHKDAITKTT